MMKKLLALLIGLSFTISENALAQGVNVSVHYGFSLPQSDFESYTGQRRGGDLSFTYDLKKYLRAGLEFGYHRFGSTSIMDGDDAWLVPVQLTSEYSYELGEKLDFYTGLGFGLFRLNRNFDDYPIEPGDYFGITPRIGFELLVNEKLLWIYAYYTLMLGPVKLRNM